MRMKLPTDDMLRGFGTAIASKCHCCPDPESESVGHILSSGRAAKEVWLHFQVVCEITFDEGVLSSHLFAWGDQSDSMASAFIVSSIIWVLWKNRNRYRYERTSMSALLLVKEAMRQFAKAWRSRPGQPGLRLGSRILEL
ncbi:uncharacterized protein M6B38_120905 [Iris pallida]|uniref:Reverse transcriptase zinc-binding domain-containing protein n=1 Tax=Iris pallida TaxID=29817 RepID=A0AAX6H9P8_IRIPA|nr:uncharacterized protein M6B38_120905 [Iris pallida]